MKRVSAEEARGVLGGFEARSSLTVTSLASTIIALEADLAALRIEGEAHAALLQAARDAGYEARGQLAGLRIEHEAFAALLTATRRDRDAARSRIAGLEEEQRRDLADVERFRTWARVHDEERDEARAERDRLRDILAAKATP